MDSDMAYLNWISSLKERIRSAQIKAAIAVNEELINLNWEIGESDWKPFAKGKHLPSHIGTETEFWL